MGCRGPRSPAGFELEIGCESEFEVEAADVTGANTAESVCARALRAEPSPSVEGWAEGMEWTTV